MDKLTTGIVFLEGIASFLSPCFLPLIPIYIGYISGETVQNNKKADVLKNSIAFVLGFTAVFIILGAAASGIGKYIIIHKRFITKVLGILVIIMGLFYMDLLKLEFLNIERRFNYEGKKRGIVGAFILGSAIGFGWTPCIGPILASVLALAASKNSLAYGTYLLFIYSLGIAIPFLAAALLMQGASHKLKGILKYSRIIKISTGLIVTVTGILIYTGYFERLAGYIWR